MNLLRDFSTNAVCTGLTFALGFVNQVLLARELGTAGRGRLGVITTAVMLGSLVLGEWLNRGNTYVTGKEGRATDVVASSLAYTACLAVLIAVAAAVAGAVQPFAELTRLDYLFIAFLVAAVVAQRAGQSVLLGQDRQLPYAVVPLILAAVYLTGNGVALLVYQLELGGVLVAWSAAAAVSALAAILMVGGAARGRPDRDLLRRIARVGGRGAVSTTIIFLLFRSGVFLVGGILGEEKLGVYMISVVIAEMIQRFPNLAGVVLLPKVLTGKDDEHAISLAVGRRILIVSVALAAGVIAVGQSMIDWVFGPDYSGAFVPLVLMLPGLVATGFGSVLNTKLAGEGYPPITIWAPIAALSTNAILNVALIPSWELEGAAISTSVAYILWSVLVTLGFRRRSAVPWRQFIRGGR